MSNRVDRIPRPLSPNVRPGGYSIKSARLAFALGCVLCMSSLWGCSEPATPRGVLFISVDSLRADHLSCYGYKSATKPDVATTPNIDRLLAREGTRYTQAVSTTSWTLPSHMAMLTGLPNALHGVRALGDRLHPSRTTLAESFRQAGWRTHGIWSGPNLHPFYGFDRGFDQYVDCSTSVVADPDVFVRPDGKSAEQVGEQREALRNIHDGSHEGTTGQAIVKAFDDFVGDLSAEEPFFAFVHMWDVHYDYSAPQEYDRFDPAYTGEIHGQGVHDLHRRTPPPSERDILRIKALYDAEILFTDHNIGQMLNRLEAAGRLDDTLVVFTSDHGDEFMEHGAFGHNNTLYEEVVHVPLIMRWPANIPAGRVVDDLVGIVDLAPTVLDICRIPAPQEMWGRSLKPSFDGSLEERNLPMELTFLRGGRGEEAKVWEAQMRGLRAPDHKVIREPEDNPEVRTWFFDLAGDPLERQGRQVGPTQGDDRIQSARTTWSELDAAAQKLERISGEEMPEDLIEDLTSSGYIGEDEQ